MEHHDAGYLSPGSDIEAIIDAAPTPIVRISPDRQWLLLVHYTSTPPLEMLAQPFERLAGLRIDRNTGTTRRTYNFTRITLRHITEGATHTIELEQGALRFSSVSWSPTSAHMAYTVLHEDGLRLWVLDLSTMESGRLLEGARVNDTLSGGMRWMPGGAQLLVTTVPEGRGRAPEPGRVPAAPKVQVTRGREAQNRTYQDLLEDAHDDRLFAHYTTSQLVRVRVDGEEAIALGAPAMIDYAAPSPDKRYVLVKTLHEPFSRVVPEYYFAHTIAVRDARDFSLVATIAEQPLAEEVPIQGVRTGVRGIGWKPLRDATLMWVEALDGGDPKAEVDHRDKIMTLSAPFAGEAQELLRLRERYRGRCSMRGGGAGMGQMLVTEYDRDRRWVTTTLHDFDGAEQRVFIDRSIRDQYNTPGSPGLSGRPYGTAVVDGDDGHIYMAGAGATPQGDRPFLDRR
ncbi:MAG: S9 family peptidase, partial [Myxococcota bacterium]